MLNKSIVTGLGSLVVVFAANGAAQAGPTLDKIAQRGTFTVCTATDLKPFGYLESNGTNVGYIVDVIGELRQSLGRTLNQELALQLIPVTPANRIEFLTRGRCDATITSMNITPDRQKIVDFVEPGYFSSGANVIARKTSDIASWEDLKGRKVCSLQGSSWNSQLERQYGTEILAFTGIAEAAQALQGGRCEAWLSDDGFLRSRLADPALADYELKLDTQFSSPWGVALAQGNQDFLALLTQEMNALHGQGKLLALAEKWQIGKNAYLTEQYDALKPKP